MRTKLIVTLIMLLTVVVAFADNSYKVTSSSRLNVRKSPSKTSTVIGTFESGQQIEVLSVSNGWAQVRYNDKTGYVSARYIALLPAPANTEVTKEELKEEPVAGSNDYEKSPDHIERYNSETPENSDFESERKSGVFEITFSAGTFEYVKQSGSYGISWTSLPWKIAPGFYAGYHFSPFNFNFGLNDSTSDLIKLGPAVGYYFTPKIFIAMPLDVLCDVYFSENKTKTAWGMALAPSIYIGSKVGIFIGPQFGIGFSKGSKVSCGFRAGFYF